MKLTSIVGHILEVCLIADSSSKPVDQIIWSFFKDRKYLGSRDRFRISESVYSIQRDWRLLQTLSSSFFKSQQQEINPPEEKLQFLPMYIASEWHTHTTPPLEIVETLSEYWSAGYPSVTLSQFYTWLDSNGDAILNPPDIAQRLAIQYSFPDWMVHRLLHQYGVETESLLKALHTRARTTLRVNRLATSREECQERLIKEGIETLPTEYSPVGLVTEKRYNRQASPSYKEGLYDFQDEGSQLISLLTDPQPGEFVIDACAGGGGKTLHLSELMNDTGTILAVDIDLERMKGLRARIERLNRKTIGMQTVASLDKGGLKEKADRVLVDAPCSGVGRIRRSPDIKRHLTEALVDSYPTKQIDILLDNADFVKKEGNLVYATCSLFQSENEEVIRQFLLNRKDFQLESASDRLKPLKLDTSNDGFIRILPHKYPTDGFFIALMKRH